MKDSRKVLEERKLLSRKHSEETRVMTAVMSGKPEGLAGDSDALIANLWFYQI